MSDVLNMVYKKIGDIQLGLNIYKPDDWKETDKRACIIFFFGGGWIGGTIDHFKLQSKYLAHRGMVAITPDYRVKTRHGTTPFECVKDAVSAVIWVKDRAHELGIDTDKVVVSGGSAGGHIAACTVLTGTLNEAGKSSSAIPKAMILFNPVLDTSKKGYGYERLGEKMLEISPVNYIRKGLPPAIIFHGTADTTVPYENSLRFCNEMQNMGGHCQLVSYEDRKHGFFNIRKGYTPDFVDTLEKADAFLCEIGLLSGAEDVKEYIAQNSVF